jgi:hypothetical protein
MRFFFERALPQKFLDIVFARQGTVGLIVKFRLVPLFRCFHSANSDFCSGDFVPPTV